LAVTILITNMLTFIISLIGILLSKVYMLYQATRHFNTEHEIDTEQENIRNWLKRTNDNNRIKVILADYKVANDQVSRRDNVTLIIGTILITSSFLIFGNIAPNPVYSQLPIFSLASIGLFIIWLFVLHETGKKANNVTYTHIKAIEKGLTRYYQESDEDSPLYEFGIHRLICEKTNDQSTPWLRIRRTFWGFVLFLLCLSWMLLSVQIIF
jgi:hypothetical protein